MTHLQTSYLTVIISFLSASCSKESVLIIKENIWFWHKHWKNEGDGDDDDSYNSNNKDVTKTTTIVCQELFCGNYIQPFFPAMLPVPSLTFYRML